MKLADIELTPAQDGQLLRMRGGCQCHIRPPCWAHTQTLTVQEAEELGFDLMPASGERMLPEVMMQPPSPYIDFTRITKDVCGGGR